MHNDIKEVLYTEDVIKKRVHELGQLVTETYRSQAEAGEPIILLSVLRGGAVFMCDLSREIELPIEMDFMAVSSYGSGVKSSGQVQIIKDLSTNIAGKHLIVAEDILDSGLTLTYLIDYFRASKPASISVVTLLRKKVENQMPVECLGIGFECPNEFIVGYGLDYAEKYRNLPYIGILKPSVYES